MDQHKVEAVVVAQDGAIFAVPDSCDFPDKESKFLRLLRLMQDSNEQAAGYLLI